jgi:hypothetical protein
MSIWAILGSVVVSADKLGDLRIGLQDLTAMPGGHHPRSTIEHRTEVVRPPQLGFAGREPHPNRQL